MVGLPSRHRSLFLLIGVVLLQVLLLAVQIKRDSQGRLIRVWTVSAVSPVERSGAWGIGKIRDAWLGGLWLAVGFFFFKKAKPVWNEFLNWIKTSSGILIIVSGVFWIASGLIDKSLLGHKDLYREELMEVNSTLLMLLSAMMFLLRKKANSPLQEEELQLEIKSEP